MRIVHWLITYNGMGGHELSSLAGCFLLHGSRRSFGSSVTCFELYAHVETRSPALPTLGDMKNRFRARLEDLPRVAFIRKSARFDISFVSRLGSEEDLVRARTAVESLALFRAACHEIASTLQLAKERLKKTDDFEWEAFAAQVSHQLDNLPKTAREFTRLLKSLRDASMQRCTEPSSPAKLSARALRRKPRIIAIDHDEHHASHIGRLSDGRQFFLTTPFVPAMGGDAGREFVALYLFDKRGRFLEARIDDFGTRATLDEQRARSMFEQRLAELGQVEYGRIEVQPFEIERFGTTFGLVPRPPEEDDDEWAVEVQPGNYMAFFEPWDNGDYDT